jgi:uncharacterized protein YxjI
MRYALQEKLFSWGDTFSIKDDQGADVLTVKGKVFSLGKNLSLQDNAGNDLGFIKQKLLAWRPTYEIYRQERRYATMRKSFSWFRTRFSVDIEGQDNIEVKGNFWGHEYVFSRGDRSIASVSKQWFSWRDTYGVEIAEDEDHLLVLTCVVVIDLVCHEKRQRSQSSFSS